MTRYLLHYLNINYVDVNPDPSKWFSETKKNIDLDFPNLPYLKDGDFSLTESSAMINYIIYKS